MWMDQSKNHLSALRYTAASRTAPATWLENMLEKSRKVWIGLGVASFVGSSLVFGASAQEHKHKGEGSRAAAPKETTEAKTPDRSPVAMMTPPRAGEAYLTDGGPKDTRIRIYRDIALMRGHLRVAGELIREGRWDDALPHVLHPTEELYGLMERYIKLHKVTPFDQQLRAIGQAVKAKRLGAYEQASKIAEQRLSAALTKFKTFMTGQPMASYVTRTVVEVLKVAKVEYEASIENDGFGKIVEYQDSRGFVWTSADMMNEIAADLGRRDPTRLAEILRLLADLKPAWPTPVAPERPAMSVAEVAAKIDRIEELAGGFRW